MNSTRDRLIIFDIDGTLLLSGPVARDLFLKAFEEVFEVAADLGDLSFAGRCDRGVVSLLLERANASQKLPAVFPRFAHRYASLMREVYPTAKGPTLMPGVKELLSTLREDPSVLLLIGSGNLSETARVKLARFGLDDFFPYGVYGDRHEERTALFASALTLAHEELGWNGDRARAWIVGDTVSDVEAAREVGVKSLAVATGPTAADALRRARPDAFFQDLSSSEAVLGFLLG